MPSYKDKNGRWRWRVTYKGERHSGSAPATANTKKAADALEKQHVEKLVARVFTGEMPTVAAFAPRFLEYQRTHLGKASSFDGQEGITRLHIVPHIGGLGLDDLDARVIDEMKAKWTDAEPSTKNQRLRVFVRMLSLAVEWKYLAAAPDVRMFPVAQERPRFLLDAEAGALLEAAPAKWRSMILVGLRTGLRVGELRGLEWGDIDLEAGTLQVRRTAPGKGDREATSPKSNKPRQLPLTPDTIAALHAMRPASGSGYVWPGNTLSGTRSESGCYTAIQRAAKAAGIQEPREVAWHTLRHTYASQLAIRGRSLRVIQELLGHASITMTEIYAHLLPGATHHEAVAALDIPYLAPVGARPALPPASASESQEPATPRQHPTNTLTTSSDSPATADG